MSIKRLKFGHLNIYHIVNKLPDLCVHLNNNGPYHIFGVTETRLGPNVPDACIHINNYTAFRRDPGPLKTTGIIVYVNDSLQGITRRRLDLESAEVECVWLELKIPKRSPVFVGILYRNPASTLEWNDDFLRMYDKVHTRKANIVLLGDFNIDFLKPHHSWEATITTLGLHQLVTSPTRVTATTATILDHIYSNSPGLVGNVTIHDLSVSDHSPISCTLSTKIPKIKKGGHTCIKYRSYKTFSEENFFADLNNTSFDAVYNSSDPNTALQMWYVIFLSVLDKHAPMRQKRVKSVVLPPWLTKDIINAMELRDSLKRQKGRGSSEYKRQRNYVTNMVRESKKCHVDQTIRNNSGTHTMWRAIDVVTGAQTGQKCIPAHLKAEEFNNHFLNVGNSIASPCDSNVQYECSAVLRDFCSKSKEESKSLSIPLLAVHEVGKLISSMPNKKSAGPDEICAKILKLSLPYTICSLTYIYNLSILRGIFPDQLKHAKVIPIPKTKDNSVINNYRPISLVSVLCKPLERHVHKHVVSHLKDCQLLYSLQSGYRAKHSCHTAITRITDTWLSAINNSDITGALFLDLRKAFDLVHHNILFKKLKLYLGEPIISLPQSACQSSALRGTVAQSLDETERRGCPLSFFKSYLSERTQHVLVNGIASSSQQVGRGVPQGSVLGPLLFSLFINDLPLHLTEEKVSCDLFADDATVHTQDKDINIISSRLQQTLLDVFNWCDKNLMVLNPEKTECMVITTRQKHQLEPLTLNLLLQDKPIEQVSEHCLLGVTVDKQLQWKTHIKNIRKKVSRNVYLLSKLKLYVNTDARLLFYNAHIRSHFNYASTVWDGSADVHLKTLNSLNRRAAKQILPTPDLSTDQKLNCLKILPLHKQLLFNKGVTMFKIFHGSLPEYLCNLFSSERVRYYSTRRNFNVPKPRIDLFKTSLSYSGPAFWNQLPIKLRDAPSLTTFKNGLHNWLSQQS